MKTIYRQHLKIVTSIHLCLTEYEECGVEDFTCGNKRCVPMFYVCDGDDDCRDRTDEKFCDTFCANATAGGPSISPFCSKVCLNITEQVRLYILLRYEILRCKGKCEKNKREDHDECYIGISLLSLGGGYTAG